jgi:alpha/beta superfamily hydrolase
MHSIDKIIIETNDIRLEAEFFQLSTNISQPVVLICHPHPQFFWV